LARSITNVHPFSIHLQKKLIIITKYRWNELVVIFQTAQMHVFFIITLHLDPSISE
jgi:hypothetical protein